MQEISLLKLLKLLWIRAILEPLQHGQLSVLDNTPEQLCARLTGRLPKRVAGEASISQTQHVGLEVLDRFVRQAHLGVFVTAQRNTEEGVCAVLQQSHAANLRVASLAFVCAGHAKGFPIAGFIGNFQRSAIQAHEPQPAIKRTLRLRLRQGCQCSLGNVAASPRHPGVCGMR